MYTNTAKIRQYFLGNVIFQFNDGLKTAYILYSTTVFISVFIPLLHYTLHKNKWHIEMGDMIKYQYQYHDYILRKLFLKVFFNAAPLFSYIMVHLVYR